MKEYDADTIRPSPEEPATDEMFHLYVTDFLASFTTEGLKNVEYGVAAANHFVKDGKRLGGPADFALMARPPNLLGHAYHQLAQLMSRGVPGLRCPECGRVFIIKDRRQRFCSPQCAQRGRYRRWKEKQA